MKTRMLLAACLLASMATQCAGAVITDFPHKETFENGGALPSGWVSDPAGGYESWECRTGVIDGPDADHTSGSGYFVRVNNWWRTTLESWLYLPPLDLSGMTQPTISYWHCVGDETASGNEAYLYLEAKQGESWVPVGATKRWTPYFWNALAVTNLQGAALWDDPATNRLADPPMLDGGATYYWRVVAYAANGLATTGTVWSFTTQPEPLKTLPYATGFDLNPWAEGWSPQGDGSNLWSRAATAVAGGKMPEMHCETGSAGTARLVSPPLATAGSSFLNLSFKHDLDYYDFAKDPVWMRIQTSADGENWSDEYVAEISADIGPETFATQVAAQPGGVTYVAFTIDGVLWDIDGWWIDDVAISASLPPQPPWSPHPSAGGKRRCPGN